MPSAKNSGAKSASREKALRRWARYRAANAAAERKGAAMLKNSTVLKGRDGTWHAKMQFSGRTIRKAGFRTRREAKQWLQAQSKSFVLSEKGKALSALPGRDKSIAAAFERIGAR